MVAKKTDPKKKSQKKSKGMSAKTQSLRQQLNHEWENNFKSIQQHKTKMEELTAATIQELKSLQDLSKKAAKSGHDTNHKSEMDYQMTNLKMIKKILALTTPFESEQCAPEKKTPSLKKRAAPKKEKKLKKTEPKTNAVTKILIVEDDRTTIKIISHILEQNNFTVAFATDAEEGLKKAFKDEPDLILLDIMLPGMDGLQLLSKLQASDKACRIPVIILSSLSGEKDILKGLEKGATDYILKPFSPQILFFKIKKILSLKNEHIAFTRHL
jgi:PleD family two-component response regulator